MRPKNDRKWIEAIINHREMPVPYNFMFSPVSLKIAEQHYGSPIADAINLPIRMISPKSIKPLYADPAKFGDTAVDEYGVIWSTSTIDRGAPIGPVLKNPTLSGYRFPDPGLPYRFEDIENWCERQKDHYRIIWVGDLWERATFMRGMGNLLIDIVLHPDFVIELLAGITDYILGTMEILFERFEFEAIALSDDYGTQKGMLISPQAWRRFIKPFVSKIYGYASNKGKKIFQHSCGNIIPIIPDLLELGLDILHPIQPEAMDINYLKKEFGADLCFCGGIRTQDLLVKGTPEQVRDEVKRLKETMGKGGGYILEPGITIQADVPACNLFAMIDEAMNL
ncbi:MAG: uroporphyrinogen decarboxylase family protein [Candidatus Ratteibacteria bacterium]